VAVPGLLVPPVLLEELPPQELSVAASKSRATKVRGVAQ
jgi:hypothetical protein